MKPPDEAFADAIEAAVTEAERGTSAEIVVVVAPRAGSYVDLAVAGGALAAWLTLCFLLFSPLHFSALSAALEAPLVGLLVGFWLHRSPRLLRRLARPPRLRAAVSRAASAAFHQEAVHCTRARTGVLVYVAALEDQVRVLVDAGVATRVPDGAWLGLRWGSGRDPSAPGDTAQIADGLRAVGKLLAAHLPADPDDHDEIGNRPRMQA